MKGFDSYDFRTRNQTEFLEEIDAMDRNSVWTEGVVSKRISVLSCESSDDAEMLSLINGIDMDLCIDTIRPDGMKLFCAFDEGTFPMRDTAWPSLLETAKLSGNALSRMDRCVLAEVLNHGLKVAKGRSLILTRYGKVAAIHSSDNGGYERMPISDLLWNSLNVMQRCFGEPRFISGYNSHGLTSAMWTLPEVTNGIMYAYYKSLSDAYTDSPLSDLTPALRFVSSDTALSCACLLPVFHSSSGYELSLTPGVRIKHKKPKNGSSGMQLFLAQSMDLYSQFQASVEKIQALLDIPVSNPENCVVSLCKRYLIPKKYGEQARLAAERLAMGRRMVTAHDIFIAMSGIAYYAEESGAAMSVVNDLREKVAKVAGCKWSEHDVGGVVAWSN